MTTMSCAGCSAALPHGASFCGECGSPTQAAAATEVTGPLPSGPAPLTPAFAAATAEPVVLVRRRPDGPRLLPREIPPAEQGVTLSRNVLGSRAETKPQTSRERRIAGALPDWEPMPPGELLVRRTR